MDGVDENGHALAIGLAPLIGSERDPRIKRRCRPHTRRRRPVTAEQTAEIKVHDEQDRAAPSSTPSARAMIEPVFAHTKFNRRMDRFQRRGRSAARSEWRLITATHTLRG